MRINRRKLNKIGTVELVKAGIVFTLIMTKPEGFGLSTLEQIDQAIPEVIQEYPKVEAIKMSGTHFFLVLKRKEDGTK